MTELYGIPGNAVHSYFTCCMPAYTWYASHLPGIIFPVYIVMYQVSRFNIYASYISPHDTIRSLFAATARCSNLFLYKQRTQ